MVRKAKGSVKKKDSKDYKSQYGHLFKKDPKVFRIGRDIPPKRDLYRFVRWPRYIRLQRQRAILKKRLKVPPALNQFAKTLAGNQAKDLFKLLRHYRPESAEDKKKRLKATAEAQLNEEKEAGKKEKAKPKDKKEKEKEKKEAKSKRPLVLKYGLKQVTQLVEAKKAKLVVIAHDVDPIELVVWLPALCRKLAIPYVIVKGKSRLGHLVYKKTASAIVVTEVRKEHETQLGNIVSTALISYNNDVRSQTERGGGLMGAKFTARKRQEDKIKEAELAKQAK